MSRSKSPPPIRSCRELRDLEDESEDDETKSKKPIPAWARKGNLGPALRRQLGIDPDEVFRNMHPFYKPSLFEAAADVRSWASSCKTLSDFKLSARTHILSLPKAQSSSANSTFIAPLGRDCGSYFSPSKARSHVFLRLGKTSLLRICGNQSWNLEQSQLLKVLSMRAAN